MDNSQVPPVQPSMGMGSSGGGNFGGPMSGQMPPVANRPGMAPNGMPMVQQIQLPPKPQKDIVGIVKAIAIVVLALVAIAFMGLFVWKEMDYDELQANWQAETDMAVATAKDEQAMELTKRFSEEMKYPYLTFAGPADYGQLTFEYPRTWSVYVDKPATDGGDFSAYLNPVQVETVGKDTLDALAVTISTKSFDAVTQEYQKKVEQKDSGLTVQTVQIGDAEKGTTVTANRYDGVIPDTDFRGSIVIFKIRDKTVILQTDSEQFTGTDDQGNLREFEKLLSTITFNA